MTAIETVLRGRFASSVQLEEYLLAGRAVVTVLSKETDARVTLKLGRKPEHAGAPQTDSAVYFRVLAAPDRERDFHYLGQLTPDGSWLQSRDPDTRLHVDAARAAHWLARHLHRRTLHKVLEQAEVWHEGRCGRCGRALTVPQSIETGFGPECAGKRGRS